MKSRKTGGLILAICIALLMNPFTSTVLAQTGGPVLSLSDIIVVGHDAETNENPQILRVDKDGNLLWEKPIPLQKWGGDHQYYGDRNLTEDAFYLATHQDEDKIDGMHRILKLDQNGDLVWDVTFSPERGHISANPVNGGAYAVTWGEGLYRLDTNGNVLWGPKDYGYSGFDTVSTDVTTGGAYLSARTDGKVLKVDADGNLIWEEAIPTPGRVSANPVDGGVYVGCGNNSKDTYRLDDEGNIMWQRSNFPSPYTYGRAVSPLDGSLYIGSGWSHLLARITMDNTVVFNITTPDYNENLAASIEDDCVYAGRYAENGVFKYDGNGNLLWSQTFGPSSWIGSYGIVGVYTGMPSALDSARLTATSDALEVYPGDTVAVDLNIQEASELYAVQTTCTVDPATLEVQSGVFGDFFDPVNHLVGADAVDAVVGTWLGAISQRSPAEPLSGDGLFATVTYQAVSPGTTSMSRNLYEATSVRVLLPPPGISCSEPLRRYGGRFWRKSHSRRMGEN